MPTYYIQCGLVGRRLLKLGTEWNVMEFPFRDYTTNSYTTSLSCKYKNKNINIVLVNYINQNVHGKHYHEKFYM